MDIFQFRPEIINWLTSIRIIYTEPEQLDLFMPFLAFFPGLGAKLTFSKADFEWEDEVRSPSDRIVLFVSSSSDKAFSPFSEDGPFSRIASQLLAAPYKLILINFPEKRRDLTFFQRHMERIIAKDPALQLIEPSIHLFPKHFFGQLCVAQRILSVQFSFWHPKILFCPEILAPTLAIATPLLLIIWNREVVSDFVQDVWRSASRFVSRSLVWLVNVYLGDKRPRKRGKRYRLRELGLEGEWDEEDDEDEEEAPVSPEEFEQIITIQTQFE